MHWRQRYPVDEAERLMIRAASRPQGRKAVLWPDEHPVRGRIKMWLFVFVCWAVVGACCLGYIEWLS